MNLKYSQKVAIVSPERSVYEGVKPEEGSRVSLPQIYVDTIFAGFGHQPDLHKDVLKVKSNATKSDIRIAYFRRGREVLKEAGCFKEAPTDNLPEITRTRIQAISMAFEILCNEAWMDQYLNFQQLQEQGKWKEEKGVSVRWNEDVQEVIYHRNSVEEKYATERKERRKAMKMQKLFCRTAKSEVETANWESLRVDNWFSNNMNQFEESLGGFLNSLSKEGITSEIGNDDNRSKSSIQPVHPEDFSLTNAKSDGDEGSFAKSFNPLKEDQAESAASHTPRASDNKTTQNQEIVNEVNIISTQVYEKEDSVFEGLEGWTNEEKKNPQEWLQSASSSSFSGLSESSLSVSSMIASVPPSPTSVVVDDDFNPYDNSTCTESSMKEISNTTTEDSQDYVSQLAVYFAEMAADCQAIGTVIPALGKSFYGMIANEKEINKFPVNHKTIMI
jgi:hypothetical protein